MVKGPKSYEIKSDNFNINIDSSTNEILSIDLLEPFGENLIGQPLLNIFGTGTGANAGAVVENNTTSVNYHGEDSGSRCSRWRRRVMIPTSVFQLFLY